MILQDEAFVRAKLMHTLTCLEPEGIFDDMYARLKGFFASRDPEKLEELIQLAYVFVDFRQTKDFTDRCRAIYAMDSENDEIAQLVRIWFTDFPAFRQGIPRVDDQNAQLLISLPRGVQRARARLNHRGDHEALMRSPFPDVIEILCANPATRETDLLFMASRRPTQNALLEPLMTSAWIKRPEVRFALAANPYLNTSHALRCAFTLSHAHLDLLAEMRELHPQLRAYAQRINACFE